MLLLPLLAALIYPFGALWVKRTQALGTGPWRIAVIGNLIIAGCFMSLLVLRPEWPDWQLIGWPILAGACFFGGQFFTVLALRWGDVSMVAPMMGCKTLFVAFYSSILGVEVLGVRHWFAALLTAIAIFLLSWNSKHKSKGTATWLTAGLALVSCAFFGVVDTVIGYSGQKFGTIPTLVTAALCLAFLSLLLLPLAMREKPAPKGRKALVYGNVAYGVQAVLLHLSNALLAMPTAVNIIYSSRGLFGISHTWFFGHRFGNRERRDVGAATMLQRCVGAGLLMIAILLVVLAPGE